MQNIATDTNIVSAAKRRGRITALAAAAATFILAILAYAYASQTVLRIYDWKTNEIYVEVPARAGDELFFGWMHSLEKIPWNEYYHIADDCTLVLDKISFPALARVYLKTKARFATFRMD